MFDLAIRSFLRNSCKYALRSFKKTPTEGTPTAGQGPTSGQLALTLQPNNAVAKHCWENDLTFNFDSAKIICKPSSVFHESLNYSIVIKIIILLSTVISPSLLYQIVVNLTLNLVFPVSSFFPGFTSIFPFCFPIGQSLGFSSLLSDPLINYTFSLY